MNPKENIHTSWQPIINLLNQEPLKTLSEEILTNISYQPKAENIFRVFLIPVSDIKVVILDREPYCTPGDAIGLSFINGTSKLPVSLRNIYKEIIDSTGQEIVTPTEWENQGVFLLNAALTVETGKAGSHLKYWESFTKRLVNFISSTQPCIWILWGRKAEMFISYIHSPFRVIGYDRDTIKQIPGNPDWNYILTAPHPAAEAYSGGNAGFFGCNHFYFSNEILTVLHKKNINW